MNHIYGSESEYSYSYLDLLIVILEKFKNISERYGNIRVLIFSDHGHTKVDKNKIVDISWIKEEYIKENILPIAIEEKYLILKGKKVSRILEELDKKHIKYKHIILNETNVENWFGKYNSDVDFLIDAHFIVMEYYGYFAMHKAEIDEPPKSAHSGLTKEEIEVPLIIL